VQLAFLSDVAILVTFVEFLAFLAVLDISNTNATATHLAVLYLYVFNFIEIFKRPYQYGVGEAFLQSCSTVQTKSGMASHS